MTKRTFALLALLLAAFPAYAVTTSSCSFTNPGEDRFLIWSHSSGECTTSTQKPADLVPYSGATQVVDLNNQSLAGLGNLRLNDDGNGDGLIYLTGDYYKFLTLAENPAWVEVYGLSVADQTSPAMKGAFTLNNDIFSFLNGSGNQAHIQIGQAHFYDVMSSTFKYLGVGLSGNGELAYNDEFGYFYPIHMGATWLYDQMGGGTTGVMDYYDGNFRFNDNGGNPVPIFHGTSYFYDSPQSSFASITAADDEFAFLTASFTPATISAGIGNFSAGIAASTAGGSFLVTDYANNRLGIGTASPTTLVHQHIASAAANYHKISNSATGTGGTDGFDIGVSSTGTAELRNRENTPMQFFTTGVNYMSLSNAGPTLTLDSQGANSTNAGTLVMRTSGGSESATMTFNASGNVYDILYGATTAFRINNSATVLAKQGGTANLSGVMTTAWSSNATIGNVGAGEDDLRSFTTAASTLNSNADAIHFDAVGLFAANANNKRVRVYFGGTLIFDTTALAFNDGNWRITGKINRVSTTTADIIVTWTSSNTTLQFSQNFTAFTGNLLASNILKLTAEATNDNDVTQRNFQVWWQPGS